MSNEDKFVWGDDIIVQPPSKFMWGGDDLEVVDSNRDGKAFIVSKTKTAVTIDWWERIGETRVDGRTVVERGHSWKGWSYGQLRRHEIGEIEVKK